MTDLEITRLCAEAMGLNNVKSARKEIFGNVMQFVDEPIDKSDCVIYIHQDGYPIIYNPLHDDAQAMALVKKFRLHTGFQSFENRWGCLAQNGITATYNSDLNRAICECVANMQKDKP